MADAGDASNKGAHNKLTLPPNFERVLNRRYLVQNHADHTWDDSPGPERADGPDLTATSDQLPPKIWPAAADSLYTRLARSFRGYTPHVFGDHAAKAFPDLEEICRPLVAASGYPSQNMVGCAAPNTAVVAFGRNRQTSPLGRFEEHQCPLCGDRTHLNCITPWMVSYLGPPRWCARCSHTYFGTWPHSKKSAIAALRHYADVAGFVPAQWGTTLTVPTDVSDVQRDTIMAARMALPYKGNLQRIGLNPWANYVDAAGLASESQLRARGTQTRATDGHWCRSLFECEIDNFMTRHRISHEPEPLWPAHPQYNASGRRRADWRLDDGTLIEAAGMMASPDYAAKMRAKQHLAREAGIPLLVILPQDLPRLHLTFMPWL